MRRFIGLAVVLTWVMLATVGSASGATATSYHGVFDGKVVAVGCTPAFPTTYATGNWKVTLRGTTDAIATVNIFTNGRHHVSFGAVALQATPTGGQTFLIGPIDTMAGPLWMQLSGTTFTYQILDYNLFGYSCPGGSVTYPGTTR